MYIAVCDDQIEELSTLTALRKVLYRRELCRWSCHASSSAVSVDSSSIWSSQTAIYIYVPPPRVMFF